MAYDHSQRWLSPYKGFRCAHQFLHSEGSCSHFGLRAFEEYPFAEARRELKARLAECRAAAATIHAMSQDGPDKRNSPGGGARGAAKDAATCVRTAPSCDYPGFGACP